MLTLLLLSLPLSIAVENGLDLFLLTLIAISVAFPASDIATGLLNRFIIAFVPPRHLPRLELKDGIPKDLRTFIVVPTMFSSELNVKRQINDLEVHYLANPDGEAYFALLSDWLDADQESLPEDELLLNVAITGINALNSKYGKERFFVYHRKRGWNPSENKWMGWERKRGKLHEFNRLLRGANNTSFMPINGKLALVPPGVRYVITLDTETKLPIDSVRQLVGTAAHPLNWPDLDPVTHCVISGYSILQPRVTPTLPQRLENSLFHQLFSGDCGMDAYSNTVSKYIRIFLGWGLTPAKAYMKLIHLKPL